MAALQKASKDPDGDEDAEDYEGYDAEDFGASQAAHSALHPKKLQQ